MSSDKKPPFVQTIFDPTQNSEIAHQYHCYKCGENGVGVFLFRQNTDPSIRGYVYGVWACRAHNGSQQAMDLFKEVIPEAVAISRLAKEIPEDFTEEELKSAIDTALDIASRS